MSNQNEVPLPRYWKKRIHEITGLNYCDRDCDCGENNQLWWVPVCGDPLPEWVQEFNGCDTFEIWNEIVAQGRHRDRKPELTDADKNALSVLPDGWFDAIAQLEAENAGLRAKLNRKGTGRPKDAARCECGKFTAARAKARGHKCEAK